MLFDEVTVLCKVVDNYGDIGFVYRLTRALSENFSDVKIRLVVDNLAAFKMLEPKIDCSKSEQTFLLDEKNSVTVLNWNDDDACTKSFMQNPAKLIFECFECGRPAWLDALLFNASNKNVTWILSLEYLSAEDWVEDFHLLPSATRSRFVKKVNFMPGFTQKTGGLVLDSSFVRCVNDRLYALSLVKDFLPQTYIKCLEDDDAVCVLLFSYPRDFSVLKNVLSRYAESLDKKNLVVFSASKEFDKACDAPLPFCIKSLPPLSQTAWDALLCLCDFLFVRGEDSFSRACLCAKPFLWEAYIQKEEQHLVKVSSLLSKMKPYFSEDDFVLLSDALLSYNLNSPSLCNSDSYAVIENSAGVKQYDLSEDVLFSFLASSADMSSGFRDFSSSLFKNGNLTDHLCEFIKTL